MKKKSPKKMLGPTLQEFQLVPVSDPVEFAALERRCRAAEKSKKSLRGSSHEKSPRRANGTR
jgi:hypothetical protein